MARRLITSWHVVEVTASVVSRAIDGVEQYQLSYYDALLWASARLHAIPVILSEDGQHGQTLEGVTYQNPLLPEFDLDQLGPAVS